VIFVRTIWSDGKTFASWNGSIWPLRGRRHVPVPADKRTLLSAHGKNRPRVRVYWTNTGIQRIFARDPQVSRWAYRMSRMLKERMP